MAKNAILLFVCIFLPCYHALPYSNSPPTGGNDKEEVGWCVDSKGMDQNRGQRKIDDNISKEGCWEKCQIERATGCEWNGQRCTCYRHTGDVASGSGRSILFQMPSFEKITTG